MIDFFRFIWPFLIGFNVCALLVRIKRPEAYSPSAGMIFSDLGSICTGIGFYIFFTFPINRQRFGLTAIGLMFLGGFLTYHGDKLSREESKERKLKAKNQPVLISSAEGNAA